MVVAHFFPSSFAFFSSLLLQCSLVYQRAIPSWLGMLQQINKMRPEWPFRRRGEKKVYSKRKLTGREKLLDLLTNKVDEAKVRYHNPNLIPHLAEHASCQVRGYTYVHLAPTR